MKFLGILRVSALCLLVSAFHGQPVSCGLFNKILSSKKSSSDKVSESPEKSTVKSEGSVPAPVSQPELLFRYSKWDDSHLASAVLFLREFCKEVEGYKFANKISDVNYEVIYPPICIRSLGASRQDTAADLGEISEDMYDGRLKPDIFDAYAKWLLVHIPEIMESYEKMHKKCLKLTEMQLKTDTSNGPLKYGFVYRGGEWKEINSQLPSAVSKGPTFVDCLKDLRRLLYKMLKSTQR
ncbi:secreted antigen 1 [Babesia divergens]|uniref:Secreted antigen 1 n=1 Tax=Babesia divergens TaxID=32595 RepID=A0AAD9LKM0_BABDI|nr:secreted antigen 1 [Babesia divergens]